VSGLVARWDNFTGDTLTKGYYTYAETIDDQLQTDREARKGVPIQVPETGWCRALRTWLSPWFAKEY
jgi:hypothetical protein